MSKNKNTSRRMPKRPLLLPLVGDPSPLAPEPYVDAILVHDMLQEDEKYIEGMLAAMSDEELFNTALSVGVKATDLMSVSHCYEHYGMLLMEGRPVSGISYATDVRWCFNCYQYFRYKKR